MSSTFGGIEIARRAVLAHQRVINVIGHNIANANTVGYSRQRAELAATAPYPAPGMNRAGGAGQVGTGVTVVQIRRLSDDFIDAEIQREIRNEGYWSARQQIVHQLELMMMEPGDTGIRAALDRFWESLQELHKDPGSMAARAVVRERAAVLTDTIRHTREKLIPLQQELDTEMRSTVVQVNRLASEIAALNEEIARAQALGYEPNDLLDRRALLVREVSRLAGAAVSPRSQGMIAVTIGGVTLVDGTSFRNIQIVEDPARGGLARFVWEGLHREVNFDGGALQALGEGRDELVPEQIRLLDKLASELIARVNEVHRQGIGLDGSTGRDFFAGVDARDIRVHDGIERDLRVIAASTSGEVGDGTNALALARLGQLPVVENGTTTFGDFYSSVINRLGVQGQKAIRMLEHQREVMQHLEGLRESVAGVNLDEEMANLITSQHAFVAASRVMNVMDELLDTLVNRLGVVGR